MWLNIGDSYANDGKWGGTTGGKHAKGIHGTAVGRKKRHTGLKPKDLCGIPQRLALALQSDGWYWRSEIIWHKPSTMPESVQDRPTRAHEQVLLFSKQERYFYDAEAVRERIGVPTRRNAEFRGVTVYKDHIADKVSNHAARPEGRSIQGEHSMDGRNARDVWTIASESFNGAHFATFPTELARRCILAGTSQHGVCSACGATWKREVERVVHGKQDYAGKYATQETNGAGRNLLASVRAARVNGQPHDNPFPAPITTGWRPSCACNAPVAPALVCDPFMGSGTTLLVARALRRSAIGTDLSFPYVQAIARKRLGLADLAAWEGRSTLVHTTTTEGLPLFSLRTKEGAA